MKIQASTVTLYGDSFPCHGGGVNDMFSNTPTISQFKIWLLHCAPHLA